MSDKNNASWEDRVVTLELEAKQEREKRATLERAVAERDATIASLKAAVDEGKKLEAQRRKAEVDGFIGGLKSKAAEKGNAIPETKLAHVAQLFGAGMDEAARSFGETLLANATAGSQGGGTLLDLGAAKDKATKDATANTAAQLRAAGWTVELSADGTQITKQTPPAPVRAGR